MRQSHCIEALEELKSTGVDTLVSAGRRRLGDWLVLGVGWASIVVLGRLQGRLVAVKLLKKGSRRRSLLWEGLVASIASHYGIAPRVHRFTRHVIVEDAVLGPTLGEYSPASPWRAWLVLRRLLWKAFLLDRLRIRHTELARPHGHVLLDGDEPYIIDYESARVTDKPRNLTQLIGGLATIDWVRRVAPGVSSSRLRQLLRRYKEEYSITVFEEILVELGEPQHGRG